MAEIVGVVKLLLPIAKAVPPVASAYQSIVAPVLAVALSVVVPLPQMIAPVVVAETVGAVIFVAVTGYCAGFKP